MRGWRPLVLIAVVAGSCASQPAPATTTLNETTPAEHEATSPTAAAPETSGSPLRTGPTDDGRRDERLAMVAEQIEPRAVADPLVLAAMAAVPRHRFVSEEWQEHAYGDHPLPIGYGQTISQPYVVALMTEALGVARGDKVLEIGTGSGYQAAVLAELGVEVYTIEIIPQLAATAERTLEALGYEVATRAADGYFGWEEEAPFDGIIVTAAPDHMPQPLIEQLAPGGVMIIPVGPIGAVQTLWKFWLSDDGEPLAESLGPVMFVPFTRESE